MQNKKYSLKLQVSIAEGDIGEANVLQRNVRGDVVMPSIPVFFVGERDELMTRVTEFFNESIIPAIKRLTDE